MSLLFGDFTDFFYLIPTVLEHIELIYENSNVALSEGTPLGCCRPLPSGLGPKWGRVCLGQLISVVKSVESSWWMFSVTIPDSF